MPGGYCRGALLVGRAALLYEDPLARDPDRVLSETAERLAMTDAVIVPNAGSTSLKFGAYGVDATKTRPFLCRGQIDSRRGDPNFVVKGRNGKPLDVHAWGQGRAIDHKTVLQFVITWLESKIAGIKVVAVHADAGAVVTVTDALLRSLTPQRGRRKT